ncbi:MAG: SAM-dependent methyltransferase [Pirellulaceae bacterium]|nr:SAM-dependent methyltransferase [Pirellulaceae bacterium]
MFSSPYLFVGCQHGAEAVIKQSFCEPNGPFRLSFSRPGFVTLKSELSVPAWSAAIPESPFIRVRGHALSRLEGDSADSLISQAIEKYRSLDWTDLHVFQRDIAMPGWNGFEPGRSQLAALIGDQFQAELEKAGDARASRINRTTDWNARVLDVIIIEPNQWWIGSHLVESSFDRWPGGVFPISEPAEMVSRAYLKMAEAIHWSRLPFKPGESVVEIGSSPGGACQYLLDLGMKVVGIDPAEMAPEIIANPNFEHIRSRSIQVKRRFFSRFRWLVCDANVSPVYTLDTVEAIVTYPTTAIEGMLLTIKLSDWEKANDIEAHIERIRQWGYSKIEVRQLSYNRRECCVAISQPSR